MPRHLAAPPDPHGGRTSGYATYMSPFGDVQTSGAVCGRVNIRLGAFLALPVLLILLIRDVPAAPLLGTAALGTLTAAGTVTYRYARSEGS
ncbi:hypothetical protein [Streptomyces sp. TS71-3]|uniref:hypothetical protein n=1 Tax=Streptomyces sp. TS71-3 TaxID=2733862 RepID=UPI001B1DFC33|nr:hypothetical protein [Streptomyces sp. TS71-3]GHJ36348.1 hypothetical protein Sm713_19570 [Streptomyces sp. TS71-3]